VERLMLKKIFVILPFIVVLSSPALANSVAQSQRMLNQLGYNAGPVDGAYGKKTRSALEIFYSENGGSYDGKLDANEVADLTAAMDAAGLDSYQVDTNTSQFSGKHYGTDLKMRGNKYILPLRSTTNAPDKIHHDDQRTWAITYDTDETNFYAVGDFNNDGVRDYFVTFAQWELLGELDDRGTFVGKGWQVGESMSYAMIAGDPETGYATPNLYMMGGAKFNFKGENLTDRIIQTGNLGKLVTHQPAPVQPVVADFNGDGVDDVYVASAVRNGANNQAFHNYFLSQPDGTFLESSKTHLRGHSIDRKNGRFTKFSHRAEVSDLDNDGDMDIVFAHVEWIGNNGEIGCFINDGTGKMKSKRCGNQHGNNVKVGDFNGDGHKDMLAFPAGTYECSNYFGEDKRRKYPATKAQRTPRVMFGNGTNNWSINRGHTFNGGSVGYQQHRTDIKIPLCSIPEAIVMDVDNDGDLDLVGNAVGYQYTGGYFVVFKNDGAGNFTISNTIAAKYPRPEMIDYDTFPKAEAGHGLQGYCYSLYTIDINHDGNMDFMCDGNRSQPVDGTVWVNDGTGNFKRLGKSHLQKFADIF
jgi:hypothetical protein